MSYAFLTESSMGKLARYTKQECWRNSHTSDFQLSESTSLLLGNRKTVSWPVGSYLSKCDEVQDLLIGYQTQKFVLGSEKKLKYCSP